MVENYKESWPREKAKHTVRKNTVLKGFLGHGALSMTHSPLALFKREEEKARKDQGSVTLDITQACLEPTSS